MKNFDRSAYNTWQNREGKREERRGHLANNEYFFAGYRVPVRNTRAEMETLSDAWVKGQGASFIAFDESTSLSSIWPKDNPRAERIARGDFSIRRNELFAEYEAKGHKLTNKDKNKIYEAEKVRMEALKGEWDKEQLRKELEELEIEVARDSLGFGGW